MIEDETYCSYLLPLRFLSFVYKIIPKCLPKVNSFALCSDTHFI